MDLSWQGSTNQTQPPHLARHLGKRHPLHANRHDDIISSRQFCFQSAKRFSHPATNSIADDCITPLLANNSSQSRPTSIIGQTVNNQPFASFALSAYHHPAVVSGCAQSIFRSIALISHHAFQPRLARGSSGSTLASSSSNCLALAPGCLGIMILISQN